MQTSENSLIPVLVIGTLVIVALILFLFLFVIIYQRRMLKNQMELQRLQNEKQSDLLKAVFETQENERKRLAEDLHDSVGQVLSAIKFNLHRLHKVCDSEKKTDSLLINTRNLTEECILEIRNIIHNVMPPLLTDFGLVEALEDLCAKVKQGSGIKVRFNNLAGRERYEHAIKTAFYRIVQELFGNAIKHSGATEIAVSLSKEQRWLLLTFRDNGRGFNTKAAGEGFGLKNLHSRVQLIKGTIEIISEPAKGTLTKVKAPIT